MTRHEAVARAFLTGNIDHTLLSVLRGKPMHGYAIIKEIKEDHRIYLGPSTVYPALQWLEKNGLVKSHWDLTQKRPKKMYMLTQLGKDKAKHQRMAIQEILRKMEARENAQ